MSLLITRGLLEQVALMFLAGALLFAVTAAWSWRRQRVVCPGPTGSSAVDQVRHSSVCRAQRS